MCFTVLSDNSCSVDPEDHMEVSDRNIVHKLVVRTLEE